MADVNISGTAAIVSSTSTPQLLNTLHLAGVASIVSSVVDISLNSAINLSGVAAIVSTMTAGIGVVKLLPGVANMSSSISPVIMVITPLGKITNTRYKSLTTRYGYII